MKRKHVIVLMNLCLNEIHGSESPLFHKMKKEYVSDAYLALVELEDRTLRKAIEHIRSMDEKGLKEFFEQMKGLKERSESE